jgi:excisionase family DNA binding protein
MTTEKKKTHDVDSAAQTLNVSSAMVRKLIKRGELAAKKIGARVIILDEEIDRFLAAAPSAADAAAE